MHCFRISYASFFLVLSAAAVAASWSLAAADLPEPRLRLTDTVDPESGTLIRRGSFLVWENRVKQAGRVLELDLLVMPALGRNAKRDPVFFFAGGPGQHAAVHQSMWIKHWMRQDRDLIFVSQRGTGGDNRLTVELPGSAEDLQGYLEPMFEQKPFRKALESLRQRFDLTQYSTFFAADDVNDLRVALGYDKINLYGGSYGARAELIYIRQHPETVRTAIMNSVPPISFKNPLHHARAAQDALDRVINECAAEPQCRGAFGDLRAKFKEILQRLDQAPANATVADPQTGKQHRVRMSREAFGEALRVLMYQDSRQVPYWIDRAHAGDFTEIAEGGIDANRGLREGLAFGMLLCVTCSEDIPRIEPNEIAAETANTFLGDQRVRQQMAVCEFWPKSELPSDFGAPVRADVPVLILSGDLDPVTPPKFGEEAIRHLPNGAHVVVPGTHGVGGPCVDSIVREFLDRGSAAGLDTSCVNTMRLSRFRTR